MTWEKQSKRKGLFTPSVMRQASLTQVWVSLVSMMLFTPSVMCHMSSVTPQHDARLGYRPILVSCTRGGSRIWLKGGPKFFWPIFDNSAVGFSLLNMHSLHFGVPFYTIFEIIKY